MEQSLRMKEREMHDLRQRIADVELTRTALAAERLHCDLRTAAFCAALEHIGRVYAFRGIFP